MPCPTGKESPVYGGAWDCYLNAYAEGIACNAIRYKVNAKQFRILEKAAQGKVHHILVKGARRSSKSELLALWTILRAVTLPGIPIKLTFVKFAKARKWFDEKLYPRILDLLLPGKAGLRRAPDAFGCTLANGTVIGFTTAEVKDDPRGDGTGSAGCDERQIIDREVLDNQFLSLSEAGDRYQTLEEGTALQGEFQDYYESVLDDPDYLVEEITSYDNCFIEHGFLEDAKKHMDPRRYAQEVLAQFQPQANLVYHQFEKSTHVKPFEQARKELLRRYREYPDAGKDITAKICEQWFRLSTAFIVGMDFNVSPMVAKVYKVVQGPPGVGDVWWMVDEVTLDDKADATRMAIALKKARYWPAIVIPDASGSRSEGGRSSHRMLRDEGFQVFAPKKNPAIPDRVNAVNAKLLNARSHVTLYIDPKCRGAIKCLENHKVDSSGKPEKDGIYEHHGDALGYPIAYMCPASLEVDRNDSRRSKPDAS